MEENKDKRNNLPENEEPAHDIGIFVSNRKGFGFIKPEDGSDDVFVAGRNKGSAFHQDRVRFEIIREGDGDSNPEGCIKEIIERSLTDIVGTYSASERFGFVKPDINNISSDIFIPGKKSKRAQNNDKVLVHIVNYGGGDKRPEGEVVEILGQKGEPGVDVLSVLKSRGVPTKFPHEVLEEAAGVPEKVSAEEIEGRIDYRNTFTVTIDGDETKDFDDAMSLTVENGIYHLGIHIADVTHYVSENGAIDKEALHRGTSVYPVDRVVPMIPEKLSTGICSLVKDEDRLTLSCLMDFDQEGEMLSCKIDETVIRVDRRMTYSEVAAMLEDPDTVKDEDKKDVFPLLENAVKLTDMFREKKTRRGAVDFEFAEPEITLDEMGHPVEIKARSRNAATMIIEELMLKANETVARTLSLDEEWKGTPMIYRSHEAPEPERIETLRNLVWSLGHGFNVDLKDIKPIDIQTLVNSVSGTKEELLITTMTLRCMKRAMYSTASRQTDETTGDTNIFKPVGHFGLAADYYCHFTSPIRRYPDLINHRIIKKKLHGDLSDEKIKKYRKNLPDLAQHVCETEHRAIESERDTNKIKMAEYMNERKGQEFEGVISGMASWGIYVALPNAIEGMVPLSSMDDGFYVFDEDHMVMRRETGGREFHVGDEVKVRVTEADPELKIIDFEFV